ncbi:MAG: DUF3592 domain-containing protein [Candidatus Hydrogenedentes bacterium]|nr:DUF3592 domain-containing protein [Candidatus Hydrogenedentota bacterium]
MPHRVSRRHRKIGWPEVWLIGVVALAIFPATVWWQQQYKPEWKRTGGQITSSELTRSHYNAQDYRTIAKVTYRYSVGMAKYTGRFDGLWPEVASPNALAPAEIDKLKEPNREVIVFYDPADAARSTLHPDTSGPSPLWIVLAAAGLCIAGAYTFLIYPAWRA